MPDVFRRETGSGKQVPHLAIARGSAYLPAANHGTERFVCGCGCLAFRVQFV